MARRKKSQLKFEVIRWVDHCSIPGHDWKALEAIKDMSPIEIYSVGLVIKETEKYLILISTFYDPAGEHSEHGYGELCIHKSTIVQRRKLR